MNMLLHGKYANHTFDEVLVKDLAYCQFMSELKFVKPHFKEFIDWLKVNLPVAVEATKLAKVAKIMK